MSFWKNKHVVLATLAAPVLGIVTYFGVGAMLGDKPMPAQAGNSYQLVEKSNCRYNSGSCSLKNVDFELTLSFEQLGNNRMLLNLVSKNPLDGVMLALVENATDEKQPRKMQPSGNDGLNWFLEISKPDPEQDRLHLVASASQTLYFGDAATKFTAPDTDTGN